MFWAEAAVACLVSCGVVTGVRVLALRFDFSPCAAAAAVDSQGRMEGTSRADGRSPNQLRPFSCTGNPLHRAHGSARWAQGDTVVLAAVYGPKPGTRKGENPEKASIEVVWKPKTGQIGTRFPSFFFSLQLLLLPACLQCLSPSRVTVSLKMASGLQEGKRRSMR